jgi:hypothetical protein
MRVVVRAVTVLVFAASWACQGAALEAQTPSTGVTIYNDGRVLVRRSFPLRVPSGTSMHQISVGMIDPGSLFSLDPDVHITRAVYDAGVDEQSVLRRSVGQRLVFSRGTRSGPNNTVVDDTVSAMVLGVDPLRLELPNGRIAFSMPGTPLYPASLVRAEPALELSVDARAARDRLQVGYFASGAGWRASYAVLIGTGSTSRVAGHAVLQSETVRLTDVDVQLLAGIRWRRRRCWSAGSGTSRPTPQWGRRPRRRCRNSGSASSISTHCLGVTRCCRDRRRPPPSSIRHPFPTSAPTSCGVRSPGGDSSRDSPKTTKCPSK